MISERRYSELLALIYEAGADFDRWPEALRGIADAYDAPTVVFGAVGAKNEALWQIAPGVDSEHHARYAAYYHRINPIIPIAMPTRVGTVLTDEMMLKKRELARTEFFNDFLRPLDVGSMLGSTVYSEAGLYCSIAVQRRRRFDESSVALHLRLAPHLARAVQLNARLSALNRRCSTLADALDRLPQAAIVVDADARVLFANREGERLTGPLGCLRIEGGVLAARSAMVSAKLKMLIAGCAASRETEAGGALCLPCEEDGRAVSAQVLPLRGSSPAFCLSPHPAAIIFISDPSRAPPKCEAEIRRRFGLTKSEAAFALEIANGDGLQASADRLGISLSTARTHLARIFGKTGVRRQAQLVRLLASLSSGSA
jgi:DNA-binding CsgD family transcriptional regulator/PAS domain-containing protein